MLDQDRIDPFEYLKSKARLRKEVKKLDEMNYLEKLRYTKLMNQIYQRYHDPLVWRKVIHRHIQYEKPEVVNM